ncbi:MAG TPA: nucleoid-structuring protein H-NS [Ohtaekwangia sp.]
MMLPIRSSGLFVLLIVLITSFGCASKKKAAQAAAAEKARIEREEAERKQKAQEEELARKEAEEKAKREAEELLAKQNESRTSAPAVKLGQYFNAIASSSNVTSANSSINEALTLFASPNTPVLIVISESGGIKDYDRPTTIRDYLNYLKDQKKNINAVSNLKTDGQGKITELELRKN